MFPDFDFPGQEGFELSPLLPQNWRGPVLPGAACETAYYPGTGTIVLQHLETKDYHIRFSHYDFEKPFTLYCYQRAARLVSFLSIRNAIQLVFQKPGTVNLRQGDFALLYSNEEQKASARFEKAREYQTLEIGWSDHILKEYALTYPIIENIFSAIRSYFIGGGSHPAGIPILTNAHQITRSPYNAVDSQLLFYHKVQEYLICMLLESGSAAPRSIRLSEEQIQQFKAMAEKIRNATPGKFPIAAAAIEMGMNEAKFQQVFRQVNGDSFYQYQLNERMKEARRLLEETNVSVKEVSIIAGYKHAIHFIKKFREHFGFNPSKTKDQS